MLEPQYWEMNDQDFSAVSALLPALLELGQAPGRLRVPVASAAIRWNQTPSSRTTTKCVRANSPPLAGRSPGARSSRRRASRSRGSCVPSRESAGTMIVKPCRVRQNVHAGSGSSCPNGPHRPAFLLCRPICSAPRRLDQGFSGGRDRRGRGLPAPVDGHARPRGTPARPAPREDPRR
jgi:hypothetical protein